MKRGGDEGLGGSRFVLGGVFAGGREREGRLARREREVLGERE